MDFIESYKHLEKLCGELLNDERRISAYIDEMVNTSRGSYYVRGWDDDLKQLKHYRWVRNKIAHEPDCTEENMCEPGDAVWLDNFYSRIMNQTDPLALYSKAIKPRPAQKPAQEHKPESPADADEYSQPNANQKIPSQKTAGCMTFLEGLLIIVVVILLISGSF